MINRPKGEEKIRRETPYPGDRSQDPFSCAALSPPFRKGKCFPLAKKWKIISHSHLPVFCFPTKKGLDFHPDL